MLDSTCWIIIECDSRMTGLIYHMSDGSKTRIQFVFARVAKHKKRTSDSSLVFWNFWYQARFDSSNTQEIRVASNRAYLRDRWHPRRSTNGKLQQFQTILSLFVIDRKLPLEMRSFAISLCAHDSARNRAHCRARIAMQDSCGIHRVG